MVPRISGGAIAATETRSAGASADSAAVAAVADAAVVVAVVRNTVASCGTGVAGGAARASTAPRRRASTDAAGSARCAPSASAAAPSRRCCPTRCPDSPGCGSAASVVRGRKSNSLIRWFVIFLRCRQEKKRAPLAPLGGVYKNYAPRTRPAGETRLTFRTRFQQELHYRNIKVTIFHIKQQSSSEILRQSTHL